MIVSERIRKGQARVGEAFAGLPGRVPVMAQLAAHTLSLTGVEESRFWTEPRVFIESHLLASEYYALDVPSTYFDIYNIEAEALGQQMVYLKGEFPEIDQTRHLIRAPGDLDRLRPPKPDKDGRMPFIARIYKQMTDLGLDPALRFCAPFSLAANVRGLNELIMDIMLRPKFAHRLFTFLTDEVLAPYITALRKKCGAELPAMGADALASLPITNPAMIEEFALSYILRLRDLVGEVTVLGWWGDSYAKEPETMFDLKLLAAPGFFYCFDPDLHRIGVRRPAEYAARHQRALILGLDCSLIGTGPEEEIISRTRDYVSQGAEQGGRILFLNAVPSGASSDHVHAAVQAARYYSSPSRKAEAQGPEMVFEPRPSFREWMETEGRRLAEN